MNMQIILYPFTLIYRILSYLDSKFTDPRKLSKPVISVGNITWGGTGKTPIVIKIAKELIKNGLKPAVLTRGYKRKIKTKEPLVVSDGSKILVSPAEAGDEPYLIAESAKDAIVVVGADRSSAALKALESYPVDIFILDDGFQQWKISRGLDIVCINAKNPFGNGYLIPAGILREPLSSLKRSGVIVLTSSNLAGIEKTEVVENEIKKYSQAEILISKYMPTSIIRLSNANNFGLKDIERREVIAISAIGENEAFNATLEKAGFKVLKHYKFRDHHWFDETEVMEILKHSRKNDIFITTQKDAVRLRVVTDKLHKDLKDRFYYLNIEVQFTKGEEIWQKEIKKISQSL
ncbi:MAG: tetraacyldisaccharide 4'-kinase [Elusimicrobia bacterium]|nr:tetraacyldisaccharide 4'-kinase [Candidatus Liberimonas magnetica]